MNLINKFLYKRITRKSFSRVGLTDDGYYVLMTEQEYRYGSVPLDGRRIYETEKEAEKALKRKAW